jgi:hypothetical protein
LFDPRRLVFIDQTGASTNMAQFRGTAAAANGTSVARCAIPAPRTFYQDRSSWD